MQFVNNLTTYSVTSPSTPPLTLSERFIQFPVVLGGLSQCLSICPRARVHSATHALTSFSNSLAVGLRPPQVLPLDARARACLVTRFLDRRGTRFRKSAFCHSLPFLSHGITYPQWQHHAVGKASRACRPLSELTYSFSILTNTSQQ